MKKLGAITIIFILLMSLVGCGGRDSGADGSHSSVRPSVSEGTETIEGTGISEGTETSEGAEISERTGSSEGTAVLGDNAVAVQVSPEIEELEKGFSAVRYEGEDGFAAFLAGGGAKTDQEAMSLS